MPLTFVGSYPLKLPLIFAKKQTLLKIFKVWSSGVQLGDGLVLSFKSFELGTYSTGTNTARNPLQRPVDL